MTVLTGHRLIAIIRLADSSSVPRVARELADAGVTALEVTLTTAGCLDALPGLLTPGLVVGVGSVRTAEQAVASERAGAQFLVTPTTRVEVLAAATVPTVAGALTPTEIDVAWSSGAAQVKLFPAGRLGPGYLRDVRAPLPDVPIVPTGGITVDNLAEYAAAGAVAVGVGSALVDPALVEAGDWPALRARAAAFRAAADAAPWH
jgi:2-dehydro-3-deoxyphosphogluconate aldolase/(4S)-4-hydroxy-2-oxoglutarate aldolase